MGVARSTTPAQCHGGDAEGDWDVGIGRGASELVLVAHGSCRGDGGLHERMRPRSESRGTVAHAPDVAGEWSRTGNATAILILERLRQDGLKRAVEFLQRARILAAQVNVEPCRLR